jgi:DNA-binding NarL/FixJ family response regulator
MTSAPDPAPAQPPEPVTVVVAHGRDADRATLVRWLATDGRFTVMGETGDAGSAVDLIVTHAPDVAFVDIDLPAGACPAAGDGPTATDGPTAMPTIEDGLAALAAARRDRPAVRLVAVADQDDDRAYEALAAGATALYLWTDPAASAADVAAGVVRGEAPMTAGWAGRIIDEVRWLGREPGAIPAPELTPTELEVLRRLASGALPAAIGQLHDVTMHLVGLHAGIAVTKVWRHHDDLHQLELVERDRAASRGEG